MARYVCWHNILLLNMVWLSCVLCILVFYLFVCGSIFVSYLYPGRDPASSHQGLPHKPPITGGTTPFHVLCIQLTIRYNVSMGKYTFILTCLYTYSHILFKHDHWMSEQLPRSYVSRSRYTYIFLLIYTLIIMHTFMQNHWLGDHTILTLHITTFSVTININKVQ